MRYSFVSATLLAAITSFASAQTAGFDAISSPTEGQVATVGSTLDIVWEPENVTGTITIALLEGSDSSHLQVGDNVATGIDNQLGKYSWAIPSDLASFATYGFKISLDSAPTTFQYSFPFQITGTTGSSSVSSASATGSLTSTTTIKLTMGTATSVMSVTATSANITATSVSNSSVAVVTSTASSNISSTLSKATITSTATKTSGSSSSGTSTASASTSTKTNAAVARAATGGFAMVGGLLLAFVL